MADNKRCPRRPEIHPLIGWLPLGLAVTNAAMTLVNRRRFDSLASAGDPADGSVWVCIPARDEETRIGDIIADLRAQTGVPGLRVLVCDDDSADGTAAAAARAVDGDPRFEIITNHSPPPPGWTGKNQALARLTDRIGEGVVVFIDADVRLGPTALERAVHTCTVRGGLVTVWPAQQAGSPLEHLVQPLLCWSWLGSVPLGISERLQPRSMAVANGQFLITSTADYRRVGGHHSVCGNITEDLALARLYRDAGLGSTVRSGNAVARCRMYDGAADTWQGYRRWLGTEFGGPAGAIAVTGFAGAAYLAPLVDLVRGHRRRRAAAALGCAAVSRLVARHAETGTLAPVDVAVAVAHPLSIAIGAVAVADSLRSRLRGNLTWKGRTLTP